MSKTASVILCLIVAAGVSGQTAHEAALSTDPEVERDRAMLVVADVVERVDLARQRTLQSDYEYTFTQEKLLGPRGRIDSKGRGRVTRDGDRVATRFEVDVNLVDKNQRSSSASESVINEAYFVGHHVGVRSVPRYFRREHPGVMCQRAETHRQVTAGFDPLQLIDGSERATLTEEVNRIADSEWVIGPLRPDHPDALIRLAEFRTKDGRKQLRRELHVDPAKGWVVTRTLTYTDDGDLGIERTLRYQRTNDDVWLPVAVDEKTFLAMFGGIERRPELTSEPEIDDEGRSIVVRRRIEIKNLKLTEGFPEETFGIRALSIAEGDPVAVSACDGTFEMFQLNGDDLVPLEPRGPDKRRAAPAL